MVVFLNDDLRKLHVAVTYLKKGRWDPECKVHDLYNVAMIVLCTVMQ